MTEEKKPSQMPSRESYYCETLEFHWGILYEAHSHYMEFFVIKAPYGTEEGKWIFQKANSNCTEPTGDIDEAEVFMRGSVGWDGCADFDLSKDGHHTCGLQQLHEMFSMMESVYRLAAKVIPAWDNELANNSPLPARLEVPSPSPPSQP